MACEGTKKTLPPAPRLASGGAQPATATYRAVTATPSGPASATDPSRSPLGTNLSALRDWSPNWAFKNALKRARPFISASGNDWTDGRKLDLDANGYVRHLAPLQLARALVIWEQDRYPAGEYVYRYQGTGVLEPWPQSDIESRDNGRIVVNIDPVKGNVGFLLKDLPKRDDYLRNIAVIMPGGSCEGDPFTYCDSNTPCAQGAACTPFEKDYQKQPFHPQFLKTIKNYAVLRFMDWMGTNEGKDRLWKDRPKPADISWASGVPVEIMVQLANLTNQHPWFTMSHQADDEYVKAFATYVRDHLKPELKAYVEYSNEVWNGIFPQAHYAAQEGKKLGLGSSQWDSQIKYYSRRAREVHAIWSRVFSDPGRLVRVIAAQAGNVGVARTALEFEDAYKTTDALAIAPYFGGGYGTPQEADRWASAGVDALFSDIQTRVLDEVEKMVQQHADLASGYGIELIAYEGGQHLTGHGGAENNTRLSQLFDAANRDPRMKQVYLDYLSRWRNAGGGLFVHFNDCSGYGKWGRWGSLEYLGQPRAQAPKYDALQTFIETNPRWW